MRNPPKQVNASLIVGLLLVSMSLTNLFAGEKPLYFQSLETDTKPLVRPVRTDEAPNIDGNLNDGIWQQIDPVETFIQTVPVEGAFATEATEVYIAYDSEHIYVGIYAHYADQALVRANRVDRDQTGDDDTVSLFFDTFNDQQRAYQFTVNGYGVQSDALVNPSGLRNRSGSSVSGRSRGGGIEADETGIPEGDISWDALFTSAGVFVDDGWTVELAIPFKSLRYPSVSSGASHRWGFQIVRLIKGKDETAVWAPISRAIAGFHRQMGILEGFEDLSTSRNLEILPTVSAFRVGSLDAASGMFLETDVAEAALNVKYGLTSNLTADFTVNPDFSQIESDLPQIEVNQRFPLFFPELRPFFLEGQEIFNVFAPINVLHTRTILDPRYGAKLTGKLGDTAVGVLVTDDEAPGKRDDPRDPAFGKTAKILVGRARYDLYAESYIGGTVTDREFLDSYSRVVAADGMFRIGAANRFNFFFAKSWHRDEETIERDGEQLGFFFSHRGRNLNITSGYGGTSPNFRTDTGFVRRVDQRQGMINVGYLWWPESWVVNWGPQVNYGRGYDFRGVLQDENVGGGIDFTFARNIRVGMSTERAMERFLQVDFWKWTQNITVDVNTSRTVGFVGGITWGDSISYSEHPFLGRARGASVTAIVRPLSRLQSQINMEISRLDNPVGNVEVFDVKILRTLTTYQFTDRLLIRNILEVNSFDKTFGANILLTYRVNSGTAFYLGYDDHYQQRIHHDPFGADDEFQGHGGIGLNQLYSPTQAYQRTNRAFFAKFSYLFRI